MMHCLFPSLTAVFLLSSCTLGPRAILPALVPVPGAAGTLQHCATLFPQDRWQFVHAIAFRMANGTHGNALGVLVLNNREVRCALMTVEGLTLFEARSPEAGALEVMRAVPPFDKRDFAAGLMRDVRTMFQLPSGKARYGLLADGTAVCRYVADSQVTDILPREDGCWRIVTYSEGTKVRTINAYACTTVASAVIPHSLELTASGPAGYSLDLRLLSAERLPLSL
jgi:hypothetical protein